ncbi:MAG TPA: cytochrome c [Candidatus Angelobacter sp.]
MFKRGILAALMAVIAVPLLLAAAGDGTWQLKVPEKDRQKQNPFESDSRAIVAGTKLFRQNCASCHGDEAAGKDNRPNLHSDRIRSATPGELQWLLTNGSLKNGMPSWSRLPEQQRWQIVAYIKSLQ